MRNVPAASPRVIPPAATDLAEVGAAIKRRRTELAYSMVEAARTAGVSRVTLHRIERGNASVTIGRTPRLRIHWDWRLQRLRRRIGAATT